MRMLDTCKLEIKDGDMIKNSVIRIPDDDEMIIIVIYIQYTGIEQSQESIFCQRLLFVPCATLLRGNSTSFYINHPSLQQYKHHIPTLHPCHAGTIRKTPSTYCSVDQHFLHTNTHTTSQHFMTYGPDWVLQDHHMDKRDSWGRKVRHICVYIYCKRS